MPLSEDCIKPNKAHPEARRWFIDGVCGGTFYGWLLSPYEVRTWGPRGIRFYAFDNSHVFRCDGDGI